MFLKIILVHGDLWRSLEEFLLKLSRNVSSTRRIKLFYLVLSYAINVLKQKCCSIEIKYCDRAKLFSSFYKNQQNDSSYHCIDVFSIFSVLCFVTCGNISKTISFWEIIFIILAPGACMWFKWTNPVEYTAYCCKLSFSGAAITRTI